MITLASWLMLVETTLALAAPWPLKIIIDYGLGHRPLAGWLRPLEALRPVPLAVAAAAAGVLLLATAALLGYLVTYLMAAASVQAGRDMQLLIINHLLRIPPGRAARYPLGELTARAGTDALRVSDTIVTAAEVLIPEITVLAGMAAVTTALDWRLTLVAVAVVPLLALTARARNRGVRAAQRHSRRMRRRRVGAKRGPARPAAVGPRLRPRGHRDSGSRKAHHPGGRGQHPGPGRQRLFRANR